MLAEANLLQVLKNAKKDEAHMPASCLHSCSRGVTGVKSNCLPSGRHLILVSEDTDLMQTLPVGLQFDPTNMPACSGYQACMSDSNIDLQAVVADWQCC